MHGGQPQHFRSTGAIVADSNPKVGEASVRTVINLHVNDPSMPITQLARRGGDTKDRYVYIVYPGETLRRARWCRTGRRRTSPPAPTRCSPAGAASTW